MSYASSGVEAGASGTNRPGGVRRHSTHFAIRVLTQKWPKYVWKCVIFRKKNN